MKEYTPEEVSSIASENCPQCGAPMSYNDELKGFTCNGCHLLIPYATYKECQAKNRERIDAYLEELEKKHANKN